MRSKHIVLIIILFTVILSAVVLLKRNVPRSQDVDQVPVETAPIVYESKEFPVRFMYPRKYFIIEREHEKTSEGPARREITLYEDTPENRNLLAGNAPGREGPPTISLLIIPEPKRVSIENWLLSTPISNWNLSDKTVTPMTVGGKDGVYYQFSGLYENDATVVRDADYVYLFTGSYLAQTDVIRNDFRSIINSVTFEERY